MAEIDDLLARLEIATEGSRELDWLIAGSPTWNDGSRNYNVPHYSTSLDVALTLRPDGWFWQCGRTSIYQGWARVYKTHPDHGEAGINEFVWHRENYEPPSTPVIALCIVALKARNASRVS